ncbi:MAG TPA: homocysteine S-methyltransferase [Caulobacteraceae bacterium]|jgi:homocysteine S-methyltransferase
MTSNPLADALSCRDVLIVDGAMGTELERRGWDLADPLWSARLLIEAPEAIAKVHRDYLAAGADVIVTASYQASIDGFVARGLTTEAARKAIRASAELALSERDAFWAGLSEAARAGRLRPLVAGGIGPYGAALADRSEFRGDYPMDPARLTDFHAPRIAALLEGGVDFLALETFPSAVEARIVVDLLEARFPQASSWVSFSTRDGARISDGATIETAIQAVADRACVSAVGVNCTAPEHIGELVRRIASVTDKPIVVYPNEGPDGADPPPFLAQFASAWRAAGARLIGGCCWTRPADIAALRAAVG